jgi:type I restriction enzyme, S subunit
MSQFDVCALGDISSFIRGINFKPDDVVDVGTPNTVACMRTKNVQETLDLSDVWGISEEFVRRQEQFLESGDILVSSANSWNLVGKCCWIPDLPWKSSFGGFVSVLRPNKDKINPRYLYQWFSSKRVQNIVRSFGRKTTNISNLDINLCLSMEIPLPPIDQQKRIAAILDKAEELRRPRRQSIEQLDILSRSIFIEMFGNPLANPKKWETPPLREIALIERGKFTPRPRNDPSYYSGKFPFIQTGDISNSIGRLNTWTQTLNDKGIKVSRSFPSGTIVVAVVGATIGMTAILGVEVYCPDSVVGIQVFEGKAIAEYLDMVLQYWRPIFIEQAPATARANINLETFRPLQVPIPPFHLQQEFAQRIQAIEHQKSQHRESLAQLDKLFASLQHRAFRGEL